MNIVKKSLLTAEQWNSIEHSNLHASMMCRKYLITTDSIEEANSIFKLIDTHCKSMWYVEAVTATKHYYFFCTAEDESILSHDFNLIDHLNGL